MFMEDNTDRLNVIKGKAFCSLLELERSFDLLYVIICLGQCMLGRTWRDRTTVFHDPFMEH